MYHQIVRDLLSIIYRILEKTTNNDKKLLDEFFEYSFRIIDLSARAFPEEIDSLPFSSDSSSSEESSDSEPVTQRRKLSADRTRRKNIKEKREEREKNDKITKKIDQPTPPSPLSLRKFPVEKTSQESNLTPEQDALMRKLYYSESLFVGRDRFYKYLTANYADSGISRRDVMRWLKLQKTWQLSKQPPRRAHTSLLSISKVGYMNCDLKGPMPADQGYNYIFGLVDVASRYQYILPIKDASAEASRDALKKIIDDNCLHITLLRSDNGTHFYGVFSEFLLERGIKQLYSPIAEPWSCRQERQWLTFKLMLSKYQLANNTKSWVNIPDTLVDHMNNTVNRSMKMTPYEAENGELPIEVNVARSKKFGVMNRFHSTKSTYKVRDLVRTVLKDKGKYSKSIVNYSSEVYVIVKVVRETDSCITTYKVSKNGINIEKKSYNITELLLVNNTHDFETPETAPEDEVGERTIYDQREVNKLLINSPEVSVIRESRKPLPDKEGNYEVEKILSQRKFSRQVKYLVKYVGYPVEESTWELAKDINAKNLLAEFRKNKRKK